MAILKFSHKHAPCEVMHFNFFAVASSWWGKFVDPKLFHRVLLGEVKVLIQNFLFHHVLGEVKI